VECAKEFGMVGGAEMSDSSISFGFKIKFLPSTFNCETLAGRKVGIFGYKKGHVSAG